LRLQRRGAASAWLRRHASGRPQIVTTLGLIPKWSAAARREVPVSTSSITRARESMEQGFGIARSPA
jgi:hypothetical protein